EPGEQALFRGLGVFAGGCTVEAIEQVCGGSDPQIEAFDGVTSLVGKSLLQRQAGAEWAGGAEPRFVMLETIREFAREKLRESGELDATCDRHLDYFTQVAEKSDQETLGGELPLWMRRLDADQNNMRAALEWSLTGNERAGGRRAELGLRLVGTLGRYWQFRSYLSEGRQWCALLLDKTEPAGPSVDRARALRALARFEFELGDSVEARRLYEQSLAISRALGDGQGEAATLLGLGILAMWQGEYDLSRSVYEESLAIGRRIGAKALIASAVGMLGVIHMRNEEYYAAQAALEEALALNREEGNDAAIADTLVKQGSVAIHLGEYEKAKALIEEGIGISRDMGLEWVTAFSLARLGLLALRLGDPQHAETFLLEALDRAQRTGVKRWSRWYLVGLAEVARLRGNAERAAKLIGASGGVATGPDAHYEPATRGEIERIVAGVRAELDEETFERLSAEGRAMSLDEIMAFASTTGRTVSTGRAEASQANPADLTEREIQVLRLMALGKSNLEIGQELVLSRRTVERHISNIYEKIGASGKVARAAAAAYALRHGLAT
ncbi:MAG TPA: tetratricopeptide repeat protein, partial [Chloroflexia bacterium]|nr:tetratricopeptide repeat protein [Chloroflexia bacterium]